ncbi:hypothetical protein OG895_28580 [Streptomyces sp. NBC_00201]|uniref:hypothetical protein n=1 Tax=unclassified Streptomyces TaxID=2593676 RepID=UPI00225839C9|nr:MULTISPECIES: hypothetical protein [unclassified Streptomyces]MCX5051250.1 hypothetical protein [Streptomyces sp. NBC_00474]MCX5249135.1 hypothetical protein [Streptomyces sp. NBC_00201]
MGSPISAAHTAQILRYLARTHPEALDGLDPHPPALALTASQVSALGVDGNLRMGGAPQQAEFWGAVRRTVGQVAEAAVVAEQTGRGGRDLLKSVVDDMCPTPPYREFPWPKRWPVPVPPNPIGPEFVTPAVQVVTGLMFQAYADRIADKSLSGAFGEAADKLLAASLRNA